jgi:hypothetical protein
MQAKIASVIHSLGGILLVMRRLLLGGDTSTPDSQKLPRVAWNPEMVAPFNSISGAVESRPSKVRYESVLGVICWHQSTLVKSPQDAMPSHSLVDPRGLPPTATININKRPSSCCEGENQGDAHHHGL